MTSVQVVLYAEKLMRFSKGNKFVHLFLSPPLVSADGHLPVRFHFFSLLLLSACSCEVDGLLGLPSITFYDFHLILKSALK